MTVQRRAQERRRKIIETAWSGLFARIVTTGVSLLMLPLAVRYLGREQYGLWVAVSSLVAMLGFMDGGAGNAVINMVAHASGEKQDDLAKIVSTAFFSLMALACIGFMLFLAVFPFVSWGKLLGVAESASLSDVKIIVIIVGLFFFVNMFSNLVGKIQRGLQEGNLDNFWSGVGAVLSLLFVYIAIQKDAGLVGFVVAFLAGSMFAYLASNVHYLFIRRRDLYPQLGKVDVTIAKNLFAVGGLFFVLQITATIQGQADNVIIANMLGPAAVTNYAICMKLFFSVSTLFGLVLAPLWPAYREAIASGDMQWVKRIFFKSMRWTLAISIPTALLLILSGGKIIELWVGQEAAPSTSLLVGCGIWMILLTAGSALAALLNSLQLLNIQLTVAISSATVNIILTIWLIRLFGVEGAVWGSVISYLICSALPYSLMLRNILIPSCKESSFGKY